MKSASQPYCRCCGKPIRKRTETHFFGRDLTQSYNQGPRNHAERPATQAEAQRHVNAKIVSVRRTHVRPTTWGGPPGPSYIASVNVWDGETYEPVYGHFCTNACAAAFGELAARETDLRTQRAVEAAEQRRARA